MDLVGGFERACLLLESVVSRIRTDEDSMAIEWRFPLRFLE